MSLISWLSSRNKPMEPAAPDSTSGLSRVEATRPVTPRHGEAHAQAQPEPAQPANRKGERMAQRELLYGVVREAMVRAGLLSSSYKFKVLSLDARGRQFLLMVDLASQHGREVGRLAELEAMIAQSAKSRHDIEVRAVYWRMNEHVAVGRPDSAACPATSRPAPLAPAPAPSQVVPKPRPSSASPFDPIDADEVAAFKQALAAGIARPVTPAAAHAFDGSAKHGPQSYTLLTGFEDTELPESEARAPALSTTQYGDLI